PERIKDSQDRDLAQENPTPASSHDAPGEAGLHYQARRRVLRRLPRPHEAPPIEERRCNYHLTTVRVALQEGLRESRSRCLHRLVPRLCARVPAHTSTTWQPRHRNRWCLESRTANALRLPLRVAR